MPERADLELDTLTIRIPIRLQRRGGRKLIMTPEGVAAPARKSSRDETLVKALVRAHRWRRRIESGQAKSITDLAEQEGVTDAYVCRLLPLTCLAPNIVEALLDGRQPKGPQAGGDTGEWAARVGGATRELGFGLLVCNFDQTVQHEDRGGERSGRPRPAKAPMMDGEPLHDPIAAAVGL